MVWPPTLGDRDLLGLGAQDVADAPDPEGEDQDDEQDLEDPGGGFGANELKHGDPTSGAAPGAVSDPGGGEGRHHRGEPPARQASPVPPGAGGIMLGNGRS